MDVVRAFSLHFSFAVRAFSLHCLFVVQAFNLHVGEVGRNGEGSVWRPW
jgi:hypothetical protein